MSASASSLDRLDRLDGHDGAKPLQAPRARSVAIALFAIGLLVVGALLIADPRRAWSSVLQGMMLPVWIGIGGLFFLAVHVLGNAWWTVPIRRVIEGMTAGLPVVLLGLAGIAIAGGSYLYEWWYLTGADHAAARSSLFHGDAGKSAWMQPVRWIITSFAIVGAWILVRHLLVAPSLAQKPGEDIRPVLVPRSVLTLIVVAFTFTLFTWDSLLSLHVTFTSAIWGMYCFVGAVQTFLGALILVLYWLSSGERAPLRGLVPVHVRNDIGTWMVAWGCIVAYITFAQYVVVYYANLDEETEFFVIRGQHGYGMAYAIEAVLRTVAPFAILMSQRLRSEPHALVLAALCVLVGNWTDLWWIVAPAFSKNHLPALLDLPEAGVACLFVGLWLLLLVRFLSRHPLVAGNDPRCLPAIKAEHLH